MNTISMKSVSYGNNRNVLIYRQMIDHKHNLQHGKLRINF